MVTNLLGALPHKKHTENEVTAASVSVQKQNRETLHLSDKIKLSKEAREEGSDTFSFFETDGKTGFDFKAVHALHIRIDALLTTLKYYDMDNVFQIIPSVLIPKLQSKISGLFAW